MALNRSSAMELKIVGNQLIMTGSVIGDELPKVKAVFSRSIGVDTVILRNSPGGNAPTGYRIWELFREKGLRTAVSGYCHSSCSRMFLGGATRVFTDDYPPEYTEVGFHGHYGPDGRLRPDIVRQHSLKDWIIKYSDGKADAELVEQWINIPRGIGMIHFYHPALLQRGGVSTFMCQGDEPADHVVFGCEAIPKTAFDLGVVTSLEILQSNDQVEMRAAIPARPSASGYAAIDDITNLPVTEARGVHEYQRFLAAGRPRAFAIAPGAQYWAWNAGTFDAMAQALSRCAQRSGLICQLYAVDEIVVWMSK
jgi:hypothetical protein